MIEEENYIITLDNNKKYTIVYALKYNEKDYAYLSSLDDFSDYIIGEIIDDEIIQVEDNELLGRLIIEFSKLS